MGGWQLTAEFFPGNRIKPKERTLPKVIAPALGAAHNQYQDISGRRTSPIETTRKGPSGLGFSHRID